MRALRERICAAAMMALMLGLAIRTLSRASKHDEPYAERVRSSTSAFATRVEERAEPSAALPTLAEPQEHADAPMEPDGSAELSGTVMDAMGGPVPFARVTFQSADGAVLGALKADVDGRFEARVPPGDVCVQARALAFARATRCALAPDSGVEIVLPPAAEIVGRVVAAGSAQGVGGVTVIVQPVSHADDWARLNQEGPHAVLSAVDGRFRVGELRGTGAYELVAKGERWRSAPTQVQLDVGQTSEPVLLELSPAATLDVSVARAGEPCEGAEVALSGPAGVVVRTGESGEAHVPGLPRGRYSVRVHCAGAVLHRAELEVGDEALARRWDLDAGLAIEGSVLSSSGKPAAGARVSVVPTTLSDDLIGTECLAGADGTFVCSGLRAGDYECALVEPGDASREVLHVKLEGGAAPRIVLHQRPKGTLVVSLNGPDRAQGDPAHVFARGASGFPMQASPRGPDFVLEGVPLGVYQVYAELPSSGTVEAVLAREDEIVSVELASPALSSISGRVVDADGIALPDAWIVALPNDALARPESAAYAPVLTDGDGAFTLPGLAGGQYQLRARSSHGVAELWNVAAGETNVMLRLIPEPTLLGPDSQPTFGWISARAAQLDPRPLREQD